VRPNQKKKWVVDADIKGCFDNIDHEFLMKKIGNFPARKLIQKWLKAGYVDKNVFHESEIGVPQGSIISPLLSNIALHGMEEALGVIYEKNGGSRASRIIVRPCG
jgi:RNA-directed DNA polymerase